MIVFGINFTNPLISALEVIILVIFIVGFWVLLNKRTPFDDHEEIFKKGNGPYGLLRFSIVVAQFAGMQSSLNIGRGDWMDLFWLACSGAVTTLLLRVMYPVLAKTIGRDVVEVNEDGTVRVTGVNRKLQHPDELRNINLGVSYVKSAFFIAFGLVVGGAFDGSAPSPLTAALATATFILLGGVLLPVWYVVHDLITQYDVRQGIRRGELSASFEAAGLIVALGIVMRMSIAGDFINWGAAFKGFFASAGLALALMYLVRWVFDRFVLTDCTLAEMHRRNLVVPSAIMAAFLPIAAVTGAIMASSLQLS